MTQIAAQSVTQSVPQSVTVTERAAKRISEIAAGDPATPQLARLRRGRRLLGLPVQIRSRSGNKADDDLVLERAGATVLIDPVSVEYMKGSEIDFVDDLMGAAFKIKNPVATASCGCGTSFTI